MIFLIGMPGAGKTYWAKAISEKYMLEFVDMDKRIEEKEERTIKEIFEKEGEVYFRQQELSCLEELVEEHKIKDTVVACGGGTPAFFNNMELMTTNGCVIYIEASFEELKKRLNADEDKRPLTPTDDVTAEARLQQLYTERSSYYRQAHYTLQADGLTIDSFNKIIEICTDKH